MGQKMEDIHSVQYYLVNPSFRRWVENPSGDLDHYWQEWMRNHTEAESSMKEAKELLQSLKFDAHRVSDHEKTVLWQKIEEKISSGRRSSEANRRFFDWSFYMKAAAVFAVAIMSIALFVHLAGEKNPIPAPETQIVKSTTAGEKLTVKLQDGSLVKLNSQSRIAYPEQFHVNERRITLEGEAFFDVSKDTARAFVVNAGKLSVKALGTSFSISNYSGADSVCVSLTGGAVSVRHDSQTVLLQAGQMACFNIVKNTLTRYDWLDKELTGWIDDMIIFENADWSEIESRLERWFGVEIINKKPDEPWDYSGEFKGSLDKILKSICYARNLNYTIEKDTITIF